MLTCNYRRWFIDFIFSLPCPCHASDFFVLDTDPTPEARISSPSCLQLLSGGLRNYVNAPEFADVTFVVEGRTIYGHKIVLSLLSDR